MHGVVEQLKNEMSNSGLQFQRVFEDEKAKQQKLIEGQKSLLEENMKNEKVRT